MLRKWAQRRHARNQAEYWASIDPILEPGEQRISTVAARNLEAGRQDGFLFLTDQALYWAEYLGQGRRTRPMFAQRLLDCPGARIGEQGTLDVALSDEQVGSFASFAPVWGIQASFFEFCQEFSIALESSQEGPPAVKGSTT